MTSLCEGLEVTGGCLDFVSASQMRLIFVYWTNLVGALRRCQAIGALLLKTLSANPLARRLLRGSLKRWVMFLGLGCVRVRRPVAWHGCTVCLVEAVPRG
jgi:hypothetical protein